MTSIFEPRLRQASGMSARLAHFAIASIWASEGTEAESFIERMGDALKAPSCTPAAQQWLRGLLAVARRDYPAAQRLVDEALMVAPSEVPLDRGQHLVAHGSATASRSRLEEIAAYRRIGATAFIEVIEAGLKPGATELDFPQDAVFSSLSDRERDVVTLLGSGMSYAQIARDLCITRSTVGYHLGNIYAKTGTTSRDGLTDLVRSQHDR